MNLAYKGANGRGQVEWVDKDLTSAYAPDGEVMAEWQMIQYRHLVESVESSIGRQLTKGESRTALWLSACEQSSINTIIKLVKAAEEHGKSHSM